jgi:hypothetical protein
MKLRSATHDAVTLIRAEDGQQVVLPNGTDVVILDGLGDHRHSRNKHMRKNDEAVLHEGALHFVDHHDLIWFERH